MFQDGDEGPFWMQEMECQQKKYDIVKSGM
jgi:hypothetical protein